MTHTSQALRSWAIGALLMSAAVTASAQGWPTRQIRMIVPFPAGGSADVAARLVAQQAALTLGQPIVVENRAGAAGNIGADVVAKAPADGYTLLYGIGSIFSSNPWLYKDMHFDPLKDFVPVTLVNAGGGFVLVASPQAPFNSLREFLDYARQNPGRVNYASYGSGSAPHLVMELLRAQGGLALTHVPYRGASPAMVAVLGREVDVMFDTYINASSYLRAGRLKALAVSTAIRMPQLPAVPAVAEIFPGFEAEGWHGVFVATGTPREVVSKARRSDRPRRPVRRGGPLVARQRHAARRPQARRLRGDDPQRSRALGQGRARPATFHRIDADVARHRDLVQSGRSA